jgi:arsenate reductase-like glutaredoxin family protein
MAYAQATRNSIGTSQISANNTDESTLIKLMQESFTPFETILSKQAEQMSMLIISSPPYSTNW